MKLLIDVVGWFGAGAILIAYALVSTRRVDGGSRKYQGLNLVGAVGLTANTVFYAAYPSTMLNVVWALIAIAALVRFRGGSQGMAR